MRLSDFVAIGAPEEEEEFARLLDTINRTQRPYPKDQTVPKVFATCVAQSPNAIAVACGPIVISYRTLAERSDRLAQQLSESALEPEQPIAILLPRSAAAIVAMLAALKAGGAYLPISPDLPRERLRHILTESRAPVVITDALHNALAEELLSSCAPLRTVLVIDPAGRIPALQTTETITSPIDRSAPGSLAYVMYTSGTTGQPKGVMVEHQAILRLVINTSFIRLGPADCILQTGALSFDASTFEIWGALLNGGRLVLPDTETWFGALGFIRLVKEHRVTTVFLTTGVFNALVTEDVGAFAGLRVVLTGGEKLSTHHVNQVRIAHPDLVLINVYGPTENTTFTSSFEIRQTFATDIPIGRPIANTTVYIFDDRRRSVPIGSFGELYAGGDGLARGYLNDPDLTAARFVPHPFEPGRRLYRTGDLARWRADGVIEYLGRADDQIKIRGFRIEPGEIEAVLLRHGAVSQAVVVAQTDSCGEQRLVAYYTLVSNVSDAALRQHLRRYLPEYMVPAAFMPLSALPLTSSGKVDRAALPAPVAPQDRNGMHGRRATSDTEAALLAIWREVLGRPDLGVEDNFFDFGGHSMRAVMLTYRIEQSFGVILPFTALYDAPTVAALAERLVDAVQFGEKSIDQPLVRLNGGGLDCPLFAFPPGTADALSYTSLAPLLDRRPLHAFNFIEETQVEAYADLMEHDNPDGPYLLFGYSGGGNFAFRTAGELERRRKRVSAVVMLDSSRIVQVFEFPAGEARSLALEFVGSEGVQNYIRNPALKDKVIRRIERYHDVLSGAADSDTIDAAIHLVLCEGSEDAFYDREGRLVCSKSAWADATRGEFRTWQGFGEHRRMLHRPHLMANATLLADILASCQS
jgi:amino acid adenylation domain-containing protein